MRRNTGRPRRYPPVVRQPRPEDISLEVILAALATPGGYHGPPPPAQFRGAGARGKSYCPACDLVSRGGSACLRCGAGMIPMPKSWRPGRRGGRTRLWDVRVTRGRAGLGHVGVPEVVRGLGVKGLPPRPSFWWAPDEVHQAITRRGIRQRSRKRRGRAR